jgi:PRC-barrel domain protein
MEAQMLKKLMITTALSGLMIGAAAAQSSPPNGGNTNDVPAATQSIPKSDKIAPTSGGSAHFISAQSSDQWLASKFRGTNVIGADNKSIGSVNDILFDKSGKVEAYVISVGGFLGIGAKDVALGPQSFQVLAGDKSKGESDKLKVTMSVDDLKQAASFEPYNPPRIMNTSGGASGSRPTPMSPSGRNGS